MATINGTAGNDALHDTSANDTLRGGLGDDTITVTGGYDSVDGGSGANLLVVDYSASSQSFYTGPSYYGPGQFTDYQNIYSGRVENSNQTAGVVFTSMERFDITTGSGADTLDLSNVATNSHISAGAGDDHVGFHLGDTVDLGTGVNGITLDASSLTTPIAVDMPHGTYSGIPGLTGSLGSLDYLTTGSADDSFALGALSGFQHVYAGAGDDTLSGSSGSSAYYVGFVGGDGANLLNLDFSADTAADTINGGIGGGGVVFDAYEPGGGHVTTYEVEHFNLKTGSGDDQINFGGNTAALHVMTGAGDDYVFTGSGSDYIDAGSGNNYINSESGADTIIAGDGDNVVATLDPHAVIHLGSGANIVGMDRSQQTQAIMLDLVHHVQSPVDNFTGTIAGLGLFHSGMGDDSLNLGALNSYSEIYGGAGNDTIAVTGVQSSSQSALNGGDGIDKLILDLSAQSGGLYITGAAAPDGSITGHVTGSNAYTDFNGFEQFIISGGSGDDSINLESFDLGSQASTQGFASIVGGAGNDTIGGIGLNDTLDGGVGDDTADFAYASSSASISYAGGAIVVTGPQGAAVLHDFEHLQFTDGTFDIGADGKVDLTPGESLTGTSGADALFGGAGDDTIVMLPGDDTATGGDGSDFLFGGDGVDTAIYAGFVHDYGLKLDTNLALVTGGREGGTDRLDSVENLTFLDGTLTVDPASTAAQIVRLYDSFLGRAPDAAGFDGYLNYVAQGHSFQDIAANAAASAEFHDATAGLTDDQYITYVYEHSLHREPDAYGLQQYEQALHDGSLTRTSMIIQAAESPEHVALTAPVVAAGLWIPDAHVEGLELLYDAAVGRQPDATGLKGYGDLLASGTSFRQIANQMASSAEFHAAHAGQSDSQYVDSLYVAEVGRHADSYGLAAYTAELANGHTRGDILYETALSQEHQSHVLAFYDPLLIGA